MEVICLQPDQENDLVNIKSTFNENYDCQEIFYPLWYLEVEVSMNFFSSRIRKTNMNVVVDGITGDVSFICDEIQTYHETDAEDGQILAASPMDEKGLAKVEASLLPFILPRARSILVRPSIDIKSYRNIYKRLYRLSTEEEGGEVIFIDNSYGNIAVLNSGIK